MKASLLALALLIIADVGEVLAQTGSTGDSVGCYRADRPLGTSAGSVEFRGVPGVAGRYIGEDSASLPRLMSFRLLANGRVVRPDAVRPESWGQASRWMSRGDSLRVQLSTGLSGWLLMITPVDRDSGYVGTARYLSDVIVKDWTPPTFVVHVRREPCAPST
jgi:hypothetical protein